MQTAFAAHLRASGREVIEQHLLAESAPASAPAGIVVVVDAPRSGQLDASDALRRARDLVWGIARRTRSALGSGTPPRVWIVSRHGLAVADGEAGDPAVGALKGLIRNWRFPGEAARVLAGEPDVSATLVDLDSDDDAAALAILDAELAAPPGLDVVAWRAGRRLGEKLTRATVDETAGGTVVRPDGAYVVSGGLGGLGLAVTRWLVDRGAGRIVLNGRTAPSAEQQAVLNAMSDTTEIEFCAGDIATPGTAEELVRCAERTGRTLRGVLHAAGITGTGLVAEVTEDDLDRVWAPKVAGALALHEATASRSLDWWVGFSSMATLLGLPGQLAYTTANAYLDALVAWRRAAGLPANAVNWGQWSDVGMSKSLTYSVLDPLSPQEGIEALDTLVGGDAARVGVGRLRLDRALTATPEMRQVEYFAALVGELGAADGETRTPARDGRTA